MRLIPTAVAVVAAALYIVGLGSGPFLDPPEGFHAEIARGMLERGDWVTPRLDGVRYFDKPPLLYWLMAPAFAVLGPTPFAARLPLALAAVACAALTARIGVALGGPRVGLLAGLMVAANLGVFLFARMVKPDMLLLLCLTLALAGVTGAYLGRAPRSSLALFYAALGGAALAKDLLGALGPLLAVAVFFWITRERPLAPWVPWWGVGLLLLVAVPWYAAVESANRGFLWYTIVDNHLLNLLRQRAFPDEDVPLGSLEFLVVTAAAFLPWALAAPWALVRAFRRPWARPGDRLGALLAIWVILVVGFFTLSPFKLPHYGLPAFPALALLVARLWDESLEQDDGAPRIRTLLGPVLIALVVGAVAAAVGAARGLSDLGGLLTSADVTTRNFQARGQAPPGDALVGLRSLLTSIAVILGAGAVGMGVALRRRRPEVALAVALGAVLAFLPVAGSGMAEFARSRSAAPIAEALLYRLRPSDIVAHEGAIENTASLLLAVRRPVHLVDGTVSNLAFGATFPDAADIFWDRARLAEAWMGSRRIFLVTSAPEARSAVRSLPPGRVHLVAEAAGRRLYSNLAD